MKKIIFISLLAVSAMFAEDTVKDVDLLSSATSGEVVGTELALDTTKASEVKAGYYSYYYNRYLTNRSYYDRSNGYNSYSGTNSYTRTYSSGRTYSWNTYTRGGYTWMKY